MLELKIPATSANIGSGFDSLGLALDLYNYVWMEEHDGLIIQSMDDIVIPTDESNLIYDTARRLYAECGRAFPGLRITQKNDIPLTRGLGRPAPLARSVPCTAGHLCPASSRRTTSV